MTGSKIGTTNHKQSFPQSKPVGWAGFICPTIDCNDTLLGNQTLPNLRAIPYRIADKILHKSVRNDRVKNWHNKPQAAIPTEQTRRLGRLHLPNN